MRKHQKRWIALAGAITISLAGLSVPGAAAADDRSPLPQTMAEQQNPSHTLDGFDIGYLPPGLDRYGVSARSTTKGSGERVSYIAWREGTTVHGKVSVFRTPQLRTLDGFRERDYAHLDAESLQKVDTKGRAAYLSEGTSDLFWIEEPGLAVAAYLRPEKWEAEELTAFAASVRYRHATARPAS